jgi:hypothetical protein
MAIAPVAASNLVLYRPGVGSTIAGGFPQLAALVTAVDSTSMIATLRVTPSVGDPVTAQSVRHASVAAIGEQCWSWPAGGGSAGPVTVFQQMLVASDPTPGIWTPLPCLTGWLTVIETTPSTSSPAFYSTQFYLGLAFPAAAPNFPFAKANGSASVTPLILFTGRVGTLTLDTANFPNPTNFLATIYSGGI